VHVKLHGALGDDTPPHQFQGRVSNSKVQCI